MYVRFHHVIIDGYGMSLFAQKMLDALAGKKIEPSVFFPEQSLRALFFLRKRMETDMEAAGSAYRKNC